LRSGHSFQVKQLGGTLRTPLAYKPVPKLFVLFLFFVGDEGATGAEAVGEGVEADSGLPLWSLGTRRLLRVFGVRFVLFV
jgi:hypothetical protein